MSNVTNKILQQHHNDVSIGKKKITRETDVGWHEAYTFRKVAQQQIWGEVGVLIPSFSADPFWI